MTEGIPAMLYLISCTDRPDAAALRASTRPRHIEYLTALGERLVLGGPRLAADERTALGSTIIVEAESQAAAEAIAAADPYNQAGIFAAVEVVPFRIVFLNPPAA